MPRCRSPYLGHAPPTAGTAATSMKRRCAHALVVGATASIGGAVAGARCGRRAARRARAAPAACGHLCGDRSVIAACSESTPADQAVGEATAILGGLDIVVCWVGAVAFGPVSELDDAV